MWRTAADLEVTRAEYRKAGRTRLSTLRVDSVGEILRVVVPPQKRKPYSFDGQFFMRDGATSWRMSNAEVAELFYAAGRLHFERKPRPVVACSRDHMNTHERR